VMLDWSRLKNGDSRLNMAKGNRGSDFYVTGALFQKIP